jgi:hypothetical protein
MIYRLQSIAGKTTTVHPQTLQNGSNCRADPFTVLFVNSI